MHLPIATICAAIAVCRVGHASGNSIKSPRPLLGAPIKRRLRLDNVVPDEGERVFLLPDLNHPPPDEEFDHVVGIIAESSGKETEQTTLLNNQELFQLAASEEKTARQQAEMEKDWHKSLKALGNDLKNGDADVTKVLFQEKYKFTKRFFAQDEKANLKELNKGWNTAAESIDENELKSSTERLQDWPKTGEKSPDKLFKVLGLHKAVEKSANSVLISYNLERWNLCTKLLEDSTFEERIRRTLNAYCKDEDRAELFLRRLSILRQKTFFKHLKWLHGGKDPKEVTKFLRLNTPNYDLEKYTRKWLGWEAYVDAYNDLHPKHATTLIEALAYSEADLIALVFRQFTILPRKDTIRNRMLDEIFLSWAGSEPPVALPDAAVRLVQSGEIMDKGMLQTVLDSYAKMLEASEVERMSMVQKTLDDLEKKEMLLPGPDGYLKSHAPESSSKRKPESPPEDGRDSQRLRGE